MNQTINIRECLQVFFYKVEWFYDRYKSFINKALHLFTTFNLVLNVLKIQNFMRIFVSCFDKVECFSQKVIFYMQFSIIFIMIKNFFKIIGFHHSFNIIAICKMHVATEPMYRTYCGVYPLPPDFKAFTLSISLSEVGTKDKKEGIRFHVLLDTFYIFSLRLLNSFLK